MKVRTTRKEFLATYTKKDEATLAYFIGDLENYELSYPEVHKRFNKIYNKNGVKVQFYSKNPKLDRTTMHYPSTIRVQGLGKNIEKLVKNMKKRFHMESYI